MTKLIPLLGQTAIRYCREQKWAALDSGTSWPIPTHQAGSLHLQYFIYRAYLQGKEQILFEPFAQILVAYPTGMVTAHQLLPLAASPREIGRFPYAEIAQLSADERRKLWEELFDAYPGVIAAYAGWPAQATPDDVRRFSTLINRAIAPYFRDTYRTLNPGFFEWLEKA